MQTSSFAESHHEDPLPGPTFAQHISNAGDKKMPKNRSMRTEISASSMHAKQFRFEVKVLAEPLRFIIAEKMLARTKFSRQSTTPFAKQYALNPLLTAHNNSRTPQGMNHLSRKNLLQSPNERKLKAKTHKIAKVIFSKAW